MAKATFAAGCFWGVEDAFRQVEGVTSVTSGYTGGTTKNPTVLQIKTAMNGHLCRCGTYTAVVEAIQQAAKAITKGAS